MNEEKGATRESLFAEILMSLIISLSVQSCLLIIRAFNEYVTIRMYLQLIPLILTVIHTVIRRKWPKLLRCFILHILSSVVFFSALILIPGSEFGNSISNMFYLGATVFALTVSSFSYRLHPRIFPSDAQVAAIPACIFPIFGFFYVMMNRPELISDLITNTILAAVLYLVMRQVAVFDAKYYHSIRSSSRPPAHLRKQNYKTTASLVGIFILSLLAISFLPIDTLSKIVTDCIIAILKVAIPIFLAIIEFIGRLIKDIGTEDEQESGEMLDLEDTFNDAPWLHILSIVIAILILIGIVLLIINTIRVLILNAPKYGKEKESTNDGIVSDTIESIDPGKKASFRRRPDLGKGYERRIRKQFYDKVRDAMRKGLPVSDSSTPGEIEKVFADNGNKGFSALRQEYEKVRYGNKSHE